MADKNKKETRSDIEMFEEGQIWLMLNGKFYYIHEIHPFTIFAKTDKERDVVLYPVKVQKENRLQTDTVDLVDRRTATTYRVDLSSGTIKRKVESMHAMRAYLIGKVSDEKRKLINRILNDNIND